MNNVAATNPNATEVVRGLWIGNMQASADEDFFRHANIGAVVNATRDLPNKWAMPHMGAVEYMRVPVDDSDGEIDRMTQFLPHAASFIYKNRDLEKKSVLIHCHAGIQRSATIVAIYLNHYQNQALQQAITTIVFRRPVAFQLSLDHAVGTLQECRIAAVALDHQAQVAEVVDQAHGGALAFAGAAQELQEVENQPLDLRALDVESDRERLGEGQGT